MELEAAGNFRLVTSNLEQHFFFLILFIYLFGCAGSWLQHAGSSFQYAGSFSCGMWDLVPWPGIEPGPPFIGSFFWDHSGNSLNRVWQHDSGNNECNNSIFSLYHSTQSLVKETLYHLGTWFSIHLKSDLLSAIDKRPCSC